MEKSNENLFTTGELAALCKIHRKTLLFYDKLELIKPEFIGENGYRYYSRKQLLSLEIIISLRKLDIPLAEIKNYLANKSAHNYKELLVKKAVLLEKLLWTLQNMHTDVTNNLSLMENTANLKLNKITLTKENDEYFCLSAPIKPNSNLKLRTQISAEQFINSSYF